MTDRLRQALAAVSSAATAFSATTTDYDRLVATVARCGAEVLRATCAVSLVGSDGQTITPVAIHDTDPAIAARSTEMLHARALGEAVVSSFESGTRFMPQVDLDGLRPQMSSAGHTFMSDLGVHGLILVLLRVRGETLGLLTVMRHRTDVPILDELDREIAEHLANLAALALANAKLFREGQSEHHGRLVAEQALELQRSEARAEQALAFLDAIIENIPDMVFVKDADKLAFVRFNRAGETLLGIPRDQLIGKSDFDFFPREEAEFFVAKDRETLDNKALVDIAEEPIQTRAGERWLHTKKVPIVDADGVPRYLLGISEDITDRKRDTFALRTAKEAAEAANRELEAFSYSVAHDLRAPLRAIDGFSQALLEDCADTLGDVGRGHLDRVRNAAQRMASLIDDLLMLSRVTRAELRRQPVDLGDLFKAAVATLQRLEPARTVKIAVGDELRTTADAKLLAIVFDNLCSNAWKFSSKTAAARIALETRVDRGERIYSVRDNGVGFDMAYVGKLFGVFHRLHPDSEFPGTGIGLATVERIIQRHGGRIWAEGDVGKGAIFSFTLGEPEGSHP